MPEDMKKKPEAEMEEETMTSMEDITAAVEACFAEGGDAYGLEGDEAIDAVIAKLEGMKTGGEAETSMGGLGSAEGMSLDDLEETD